MGAESDPTTVVNPRGLVKGFTNLRVLDASIMPTIIRCVARRDGVEGGGAPVGVRRGQGARECSR